MLILIFKKMIVNILNKQQIKIVEFNSISNYNAIKQ